MHDILKDCPPRLGVPVPNSFGADVLRLEEDVKRLKEERDALRLQVGEAQKNERERILRGLWNLLRAYAGGGMPPAITKGIRLACQNAGMSEDHIASAELGGDDPDFVKRETEKQICLCNGAGSVGATCQSCGGVRP